MTAYFSDFYPSETVSGAKGSAAFAGTTNIAILQLYRRSATTLSNADKPNGVVTYTFATATSNLSNVTNGWTTTIPSGSDPLYVVGATAASTDVSDTIQTNEWSSPVILVQNGTGGLNTATIFLFKRGNTSTLPAKPSGAATYTFATGSLLGASSPGNTVSPFLDGWTQTAPDSAGNKYLFMITGTAISTGDTYSIPSTGWSEVRILAQDGAVGYTGYLTNETHTLTASATGVVTDYTGATGSFKVFLDGVGDISSAFTLSTVVGSNTQGLTITYPAGTTTYTVSGGFDAAEDTASVTIRAQGSGAYSLVVLDKVFSLSKAKAGTNGSPSKTISLSSSRQLISYNSANALSPASQDTVLSVTKQNTTGTVNWTIQNTLGTTLDPGTYLSSTTGDSITMTASAFNSAIGVGPSEGVVITATVTDGTALTDRVTIMKVKAGANGDPGSNGTRTAVLEMYRWASSPPSTFPVGASTYTWSSGTFTAPGTANGWELTPGTPSAGQTLYVVRQVYSDSLTSTTSSVTWSAASSSPSGAAGTDGTNGNDGANGQRVGTLEVYQWSIAAPTTYPSGTSTYTWSDGTFTAPSTPNGWSLLPGAPVVGATLWAISVSVSNNLTTATSTATWNSSTVYAIGFAGTNGSPGGPGPAASSAYLTKEAQSLFAYADGTVVSFSNANGFLKIFSGTSDVTASATGFSATASGCTGTINTAANSPVNGQPAGYYQVTAMSADNATLTLSATYGGSTFTKVFTLTKSRGGYEIVAALPTTNLFIGRMVFLTTDNKLYRNTTGLFAGWTAAVPAVDITGTLVNAQIDSLAASKITGTLTNDQLDSIAAAKVSGQLSDAQLAAISAAKISGQLADTQLAAISAGKISGQLSDTQLAAISAAKITGEISSTQIAAGAITAGKIAAESITASEIAASAITASELNAGAVTTAKLAAGAVTANEIAANAITAGKIEAGAVTTAKLAAGAVTANEIAANAITAGKIDAGAVTTAKLAAGAVTANEIAANAITAGKIEAGAVTTAKLAAGAVTANEIASETITASQIAANAITASEISSNAITADKINAGAVTAAKISVTQLDAVSATIGTLRTATTGGRTEISDNIIKVFDASNVLRVKIGNLTL